MKRKLRLAALLGTALLVGAGALAFRLKSLSRAGAGSASALEETWRKPQPLEAAEPIYDGKLASGWQDWGWGPHDLSHGPAKIVFENYGGIVLSHGELAGPFGGVAFQYRAPESYGDFLQVSLRWVGLPDGALPTVSVGRRHTVLLPNGWREVLVPWSELNPDDRPFDRVIISSRSSVGPEGVLLDRIWLTKAAAYPERAAKAASAALRVRCDQEGHSISPLIYGGSSAAWDMGQSAQRWGGNPMTRFHWELGVWNVGKDWYFENIKQDATLFEQLATAAQKKRQIALVVPMIGWVAKDGTSFGFPRALAREQAAWDPYKPSAGNGARPDGTLITPGPPTETSVEAPPELIEKWIRRIVEEDKARGARSVHTYILDNEPTLWNSTHRDVHPEPLSYDELLDRTIKYASAIRRADPDARIAGPAEWGWLGYQESALDRVPGREGQDRKAHGDVPLVAWYLRKLAEHERTTGTRLLDVLDLHFYPAAEGVYENAKTDLAGSELRLRSTRALWDPTYRDESWVGESIQLVPRMKAWVRDNYPGRQVMVGEWSFGADAHVSGGLAAAEALGRFGQQGLDAAFFWGQPTKQSPVYWAFRAFRDYDGEGAQFQEVSLPVEEAQSVSLFASRSADKRRLVLILINREPRGSKLAQVDLTTCGALERARSFSYDGKGEGFQAGKVELREGGAAVDLAPFSLAVVELTRETP